MKKIFIGLFVLVATSSSFARECKNSDPVSSITSLKIKLKKELQFGETSRDLAWAYFSKGEMKTAYLAATLRSLYSRQLSVRFASGFLEDNKMKPFECDVSVYEGEWHESDMRFYNCPMEGISISRSVADPRSDMSISFGSLKYNLGESFDLRGECQSF